MGVPLQIFSSFVSFMRQLKTSATILNKRGNKGHLYCTPFYILIVFVLDPFTKTIIEAVEIHSMIHFHHLHPTPFSPMSILENHNLHYHTPSYNPPLTVNHEYYFYLTYPPSHLLLAHNLLFVDFLQKQTNECQLPPPLLTSNGLL